MKTSRVQRILRHIGSRHTPSISRNLSTAHNHYKYIIVGGGNASGYAAKEFIDLNTLPGELAIFTEEKHPPYERPALSKAFLHPPNSFRARVENVYTCVGTGSEVQTPDWYSSKGIDMFTGTKVTSIDNKLKTINVQGGNTYSYEQLLFATGARAVRLGEIGVQGAQLSNVLSLRNVSDATKLVEVLENLHETNSSAVIIGGGYIGMETAAALSGWGLHVTMVFPEDQIMQRLFPKDLAIWFESEFLKRGIKMIKGVTVKELSGNDGKVTSVTLSNGDLLDASIVVSGIGAKANSELLEGKVELSEDGGVKVDSRLCTSDPLISAFGDVAAFPVQLNGKIVRFEHVSNCRQSASYAVQSIFGKSDLTYSYFPFFYSRLFEYTDQPIIFQFYGYQNGHSGTESLDTITFSDASRLGAVWCDEQKKILGCMLVNGTSENFAELQKLVASQPTWRGDVKELFSTW